MEICFLCSTVCFYLFAQLIFVKYLASTLRHGLSGSGLQECLACWATTFLYLNLGSFEQHILHFLLGLFAKLSSLLWELGCCFGQLGCSHYGGAVSEFKQF